MVARSLRQPSEAFYEVPESSFNVAELRGELLRERVYNTVRPRQSLSYLLSLEFDDVPLRYWTRPASLAMTV